ncbi:MAG: phospholipid/cholesterol/gamma-HCH transport system permease protein [Halieaceae bacterium]|jgi:phospholipid/cholesterol/gamma-HCH transport system permease protein
MNWLLGKTGAVIFGTGALVADVFGIFYLTLKDIAFLGDGGKRRIFWHLFKRYFYNSGIRAAYINTLLAVLLGWVLISGANSFLPSGTALSEFFQSLYVIVSIREIGPMISGIILISRSANSVTSDVGFLTLNGEFEVLKSLRMNPFLIFLMPVFFAFPLSLMMMFFYFNVVCILSSYFFLAIQSGGSIALSQFVGGVIDQVSSTEVFVAVAKAVLGGSVIGIISIYLGSRVSGGYESVSRAISNSTTVQIFAFISINLVLSYIAYR